MLPAWLSGRAPSSAWLSAPRVPRARPRPLLLGSPMGDDARLLDGVPPEASPCPRPPPGCAAAASRLRAFLWPRGRGCTGSERLRLPASPTSRPTADGGRPTIGSAMSPPSLVPASLMPDGWGSTAPPRPLPQCPEGPPRPSRPAGWTGAWPRLGASLSVPNEAPEP